MPCNPQDILKKKRRKKKEKKKQKTREKGIEILEACSLTMLSVGNY